MNVAAVPAVADAIANARFARQVVSSNPIENSQTAAAVQAATAVYVIPFIVTVSPATIIALVVYVVV